MTRKLILPLLVLAAIATSVLAPAASAGSKTVYIENLKQAYVSFYTEDGCFRIGGLVVVGEGTAKSNRDEDRAGTDALVFVDVYDACEQRWVLMAETGGEGLDIAITPNLREARIDDTLVAHNYLADEDIAIHVDLAWQGTGKKYHVRDVVEVEYPGPNGTTVHAISKAGFHSLDAVASGTITIGDHVIPIVEDDAMIVGVKANSHYTVE